MLGWWGTNKTTRFEMRNEFEAIMSVESWQLSNAPILAMATLRASLDIIDAAGGMPALRAKSLRQIEFLDRRLAESLGDRIENLSAGPLDQRGCQFALRVTSGGGKAVFDDLTAADVLCDWREPDVIRAAPVPLYNSFKDIDRFVKVLDRVVP